MPTAPTTPPTASTFSVTPNRLNDDAPTFSNKADTVFTEYPTVVGSQNTLATWENTTATEVYNNAVEANTAATNALSSANTATSAANFKGEWSTLTGSLNKPASVIHDGAFWELLNNLADVTASEPTPSSSDWAFKSGTRWVPYNASATLNANSQSYIHATVATTELTQPTFAINDFIVIKNSVDSTQTVRLLNPSNTIKGEKGNVNAGDNLVIPVGETVHLIARTPTILETV